MGRHARGAGVCLSLSFCTIVFFGASRLEAQNPAPAGADVLTESDYCRSYYQFGWDRFSPKALKEATEVDARIVARLEQPTKALLADRKMDWQKEDWRDWAFTYRDYFDPPEIVRAMRFSDPLPPAWTAADFDDSLWPRQTRPLGVGPLHGVLFTERGSLCAGLQVAYHRYAFDVSDPAAAGDCTLRMEYVGGVRVFLNGREIARGHLPAGELDADAAGEPYPAEAYRFKFAELSEADQNSIRQRFLKDKPAPEYWGYAGWNIQPGSRLWKLRNRTLDPVKLPAGSIRKGRNVLAVEVRTAPIHPLILGDEAWYSWRGGGSGIPTAWLHGGLTRMELRSSRPDAGAARASAARGLRIWAEDMHRRIVSRDCLFPGDEAGVIRLAGARNGEYCAQVVVAAGEEATGVKISAGAFRGPAPLPADCVRVQGMASLPVLRIQELGFGRIPVGESFYSGMGACFGNALAWSRYANPGDKLEAVSDVRFFDEITAAVPDKVAPNTCQPYWITVRVPANAAPGNYKGQLSVEARAGGAAVQRAIPVELEVIDWKLPDPRDYQTVVAIEQSPYAVAKEYGKETTRDGRKSKEWMPLWTDEHFRLVEASLRQLGRVGNDWWFVPVIQRTEFGNRDDSMIRWSRTAGGQLAFDFSIMDRYLDLIVKHCGTPRVVDFVVMHGAAGPVTVAVADAATGKTVPLDLSEANAERAVPWRQFANALYSHMRGRGLGEAMHWGYGWDTEGDPRLKDLLRACVPDVYWTYGAHSRGGGSGGKMEQDSLSYYRAVVEIYSLDKRIASRMGWKRYPDIYLHNPRNGSVCNVTEGFSEPFNFRLLVGRSLCAGYNGIGRIGGDYWAGSYFDGCGVSAYNMAGFGILKTLWPGPDGAEPSARFEGLREGVQESEARIFLEQALDRKLLDEEQARRVDELLREQNRETFWIPPHVSGDLFNEGGQGWLDRSRRLYRMAAEVAGAVGLDVERTDLSVTLSPQEQRLLPVVLRGWSDNPRGWRAASSEPWIVPEKAAGQVAGRAVLNVRLDAGKLQPEQKAVGVLTVTDTASGKSRPVNIAVKVGKVFEFSNTSVVLNVPVGGQEVREGLSVYNSSAAPISWTARSSLAWVRPEPAGGAVQPGAMALFKLTAAPPERQPARHEGTLTIQVGGAGKEVPLTAYVIPAYQEPPLPKGTPVWLLDMQASPRLKRTSYTYAGKPASPNFGGTVPGGLEEKYSTDRFVLPFALGKKTFRRGMWIAPSHEAVYDLEGSGVGGFSSWVALTPGVESGRASFVNKDAVLCFEIYVDGRLAAQSGPIKSGVGPRLLAVDGLEKARTLRLAARRLDGIDDARSTGVWADPTFYMTEPPPDLADRYRQERQMWLEPPADAVRQWAFLGAFTAREGLLPPEEKLDFAAAYDAIGGKVAWRAAAADEQNALRLEKLVSDCGNTISFAAVVLDSPKPQLVQMGIGQGSRWACSVAIYRNGKKIYSYQGGVDVKPNGLRTLVQLEKGPNTLLVRLDESGKTGGLILTYRGEGVTARLPDGVK